MQAVYWLIAAAVFLVLEIVTMGLTTIWFAGGALVAALAAFMLFPVSIQLVLFIVISLILLFVTRPLATHFLNNKTIKTNAESLIGMNCLVTKEIDNLRSKGEVTIKGQVWSARSVDNKLTIPENAIVKVEAITGVKLMVSVVSLPDQFHSREISAE